MFRKFSNVEQQIIRRLLGRDNNGDFVGNVIYSLSPYVHTTIDTERKHTTLRFYFTNQKVAERAARDTIAETENFLLNYTILGKLLEYLDSVGLITCYSTLSPTNDTIIEYTPTAKVGDVTVMREFPYLEVNSAIIKYQRQKIIVSEELKNLISHKFKTTEERRHRTQVVFATLGIVIAFIVGLLPQVIGLLQKPQEITVRESYVEEIKLQLENMRINQEAIHLHQIEPIVEEATRKLQLLIDLEHASAIDNAYNSANSQVSP